MKTITFELSSLDGYATYTGDVMAMFSRQPITFTFPVFIKTRVEVSNARTGRSYTETRECIASGDKYVCEYDIHKMMQLVSDVESVLDRVGADGLGYDGDIISTGESITIALYVQTRYGYTKVGTINALALYAACDWGERISGGTHTIRRWRNYPQTLACSPSEGKIEVNDIEIASSSDMEAYEIDARLADDGGSTAKVSFGYTIEDGQGDINDPMAGESTQRNYILKVEDAPRTPADVYLRWLHRDGTVGYWLFRKSKEVLTTAASSAYSVNLAGVEAAPVDGVYRNAFKQDFEQTTAMTIGARDITEEEHRYLCGLAASPCVEMLIGGTMTEPKWVRVNISAGSYTRKYPKSGQPRLSTFECVLTLPKRNTIKL